MKSRYNPSDFENKWKSYWEEKEINKTRSNGEKKSYVLVMFPYPSGSGLHVGHGRVYTGTDVIARYMRMKGDSVLYPMGWDAFGLPAENAAIKEKKNPMDMVPDNIENFKNQMKDLGLGFDWIKEFATSDPEYYKWTQWLFIKFFELGLLYKKDTQVYFCEFCKTGLAEEEVLPNGTHERCGNVITRKTLPQWIFKITAFADRLLNDLEGLDWPPGILAMQRKWIGRKEGMVIKHNVVDLDITFETFTAYPSWSLADTFIVIAPEHPLVEKLVVGTPQEQQVHSFIEETRKITSEALAEGKFEKKGVFTGRYAKDPFGGRDMPIWLANFALMDFGTGIIRCSAHDPRDYEFAQKYNIPLKEIVDRQGLDKPIHAHDNKGVLKESGLFSGKRMEDSIEDIKDWIIENNIGKVKVTYHLRDWIFSRQRYWGEPIPMVYCEACRQSNRSFFNKNKDTGKYLHEEEKNDMAGWFPLSEEELPLKLPYVKSYEPPEDGSSPLSQIPSFVEATCPHCGGQARRETDTMPNWAGSCWYFLAFPWWDNSVEKSDSATPAFSQSSLATPVGSPSAVVSPNFSHPSLESWKKNIEPSITEWLPVDWYVGGAEHAVLHLLYARFWVKALNEMNLLASSSKSKDKTQGFAEPFMKLRNVGMVGAEDGQKMSKSKGNVINPTDVIKEYGADTLRVYEMFMAPFNQDISWSTSAMQGTYRFLVRIWQIYNSSDYITNDQNSEDKMLNAELQSLINKVTSDIADVKFNTSIAAMMKFLNMWESHSRVETSRSDVSTNNGNNLPAGRQVKQSNNPKLHISNAKKFLQILAPFAPFITEELWNTVCNETESIHLSKWPNAEKVRDNNSIKTIILQVNGKVRATMVTDSQDEEEIIEHALKEDKIKKYVEGKEYKTIYINGKVLNFVVM